MPGGRGHGGQAMDMGRVHGGGGRRAGMHWVPLMSSDRGMGPRKRAWGEGVCGWWQPCGILGA